MFENLKKAFLDQAAEYVAGGIVIKCPHCSGTKFLASQVLMSSFGATLTGFDWMSPEATVLQCVGCSRIQWFADELEEKE